MTDPGVLPLEIVSGLGLLVGAVSFLRRRTLWLRGAGLLGLTVVLIVVQTTIRGDASTEGWLVAAGVGVILASATAVTGGSIEKFFNDRTTPEALDRSVRYQSRALFVAAVPIAVMIYLYRDLLR